MMISSQQQRQRRSCHGSSKNGHAWLRQACILMMTVTFAFAGVAFAFQQSNYNNNGFIPLHNKLTSSLSKSTSSSSLSRRPIVHMKVCFNSEYVSDIKGRKKRRNIPWKPSNLFKSSPSRLRASSETPSTAAQQQSQSQGSGGAGGRKNLWEGMGLPSNPGWGPGGRLNRLTEWAESDEANRPIVCEYKPSGFWLWTRWQGTVLKQVFWSTLLTMFVALLIDMYARHTIGFGASRTWPLFTLPPSNEPFIESLAGIRKIWEYQLNVTTLILTFFLSQAYGYYQKVYDTTRKIQGRINDFCMLLVMGAKRATAGGRGGSTKHNGMTNGSSSGSNKAAADLFNGEGVRDMTATKGGFSPEAQKMVENCTRLIRLSHTFFWAAMPTASNGLNDSDDYIQDMKECDLPINEQDIGPVLLSSYGLKALISKGQLTKEEAEDLMNSGLPPSQYAYILLVWVGLRCMEGLENGTLTGGYGFEQNLLGQLTTLRACMFDIDDFRAGRMPLAYVQLVQVMVDSLITIAPFALYPDLGSFSIPLVGLITLFFRGLVKLSKSFLDPFGVEGFGEQNIRVDVLVSELNFGAAKRWISAAGLPKGRRRLVGIEGDNNLRLQEVM